MVQKTLVAFLFSYSLNISFQESEIVPPALIPCQIVQLQILEYHSLTTVVPYQPPALQGVFFCSILSVPRFIWGFVELLPFTFLLLILSAPPTQNSTLKTNEPLGPASAACYLRAQGIAIYVLTKHFWAVFFVPFVHFVILPVNSLFFMRVF